MFFHKQFFTKALFPFLSFLSFFCAFGQFGGIDGQGVLEKQMNDFWRKGTWNTSYSNERIKGSVYLFPEWNTTGSITTTNGKTYKTKKINYDTKLDMLILQVSKDSIYSFNPGIIEQFSIENRMFKRYLDPDFGRNSYYEVIAESDNFSILKRYTASVKEGRVNPMTHVKETSDKYVQESKVFYFVGDEKKLTELKLSTNAIVKVLEADESEAKDLKKFIKSNGLSVKEEDDLQKIVTYSRYN
ncbi:hypothetical protein [Flagellimonas amoyensis]|uniref:hypothetical protein n=1 Tax=Flagellimonas amoyensis TaxID=2169401 RepID=UPI000D3640C5|nr:hypothetical protein [Allomuricauda amoyensis]